MTGAGQWARARRGAVGLGMLCATAAPPAVSPTAPSQSTGRSTAIAVAPLRPCGPERAAAYDGAECGAIRVFENRRTKQGRTIDVAFARWRALTQPASGAVVLLAGGPGSTGAGLARDADGWARPLRSTMDLIVVEQRGTWFSNALHCARDSDARPASAFGHIFDPAWVRECRRLLERTADLRLYSTELAAEDLDDVRAELGYETISLYGSSYGTRLAQQYMRRFPDRARAVVLDGPMPFDATVPMTYAATAQQALDRVFEDCAAQPACRKAHPNLRAAFDRLLERFDAGPVKTTVTPPGQASVPVVMSRGDFGYAVRGILYAPGLLSRLPGWITSAAASGDLSDFAQQYWERHLAFSRTFANGLHLSVLCAEDVAFIDESRIAAATSPTFLGRYVIDEYRNACALWPVTPVSDELRRRIHVSVPTLLLSGAFDPVTPPAFADHIAKALPNARHLMSRDRAHGSVSDCGRSAALHVLQAGTLVGMPDACR
jgi:pimeloyl-ACP methyl ester carboxylesterase